VTIEYLAGGLMNGIDIKYRIEDLKGCTGVQIVQVLYASPLAGEDELFHIEVGGTMYVGFVDPGVKSPNCAIGHEPERVPGMPYYYSWDDLRRHLTFTPERGVGMIRFFDGPNGLRLRERAYFETAIVGLPAGGGPDKLLKTLKWGWDESGRRYSPEPGAHPEKYEPLESLQVSKTFQTILQDNYPNYELQ
jgi:hypothetical protein